MNQSYELYDTLNELARQSNRDLDLKSISFTINDIYQQMSNEEAFEHIYEIAGLIKHHDHLHNGNHHNIVPYNGKIMAGGKGILYILESLPISLQRIIAEYLIYYSVKNHE